MVAHLEGVSEASGLSLNPPSHDCTREGAKVKPKCARGKQGCCILKKFSPFAEHMIAVGTNTAEQTVYKPSPRPLDISRNQGPREGNQQAAF